MTDEVIEKLESDCGDLITTKQPLVKTRMKRDLFRFNADKTTVVNLEHVIAINLHEKNITFNFQNNAFTIELVIDET